MIDRSSIVPCATPADEARRIAEYFAAVKSTEAMPALCVADVSLLPNLLSAFEARGMKLHDPSRTRLVASALGHLVHQLSEMKRTGSYDVFSAFIRGGDARRWLKRTLNFKKGTTPEHEIAKALEDLDHRQAEILPEKIDDIAPKTTGTLRAIFEQVGNMLRKRDLRGLLQAIFKDLYLDETDPSAREFVSAAEKIEALIEECDDLEIPEKLRNELFRRRLEESVYSLEPDEGDAVLAVGWLEVPFQEADELVIAGFQEGCVPEAVVGHPFLPDRLRRKLGLTDNESRLARDRKILKDAIDGRVRGAVKIFFHYADAKGDVQKPSRLLFDGLDDAEFVNRVRDFYSASLGTEEMRSATLPNRWKLQLPIPPRQSELKNASPSSIDLYRRCPFTYYLKKIFGDKRLDDRAAELEAWEFGNLAHDALDAWAKGDWRDSDDAEAIANELNFQVDRLLGERFGTGIPVIVAMQGESVKRRLVHFAKVQAARRKEGWRIVDTERKLEVMYGHTRLHGRCDRIDRNEHTGEWCVIDYKTWDRVPDRLDSFQLPIYCAMLDALPEGEFVAATLETITSAYCVLGKTAEDVVFTPPVSGSVVPGVERQIRETIGKIERGVFWPPTDAAEWRYNFGDWMFDGKPESSVCDEWIKDQLERK